MIPIHFPGWKILRRGTQVTVATSVMAAPVAEASRHGTSTEEMAVFPWKSMGNPSCFMEKLSFFSGKFRKIHEKMARTLENPWKLPHLSWLKINELTIHGTKWPFSIALAMTQEPIYWRYNYHLCLRPKFQGYGYGDVAPKYGLKYGTNVPPF